MAHRERTLRMAAPAPPPLRRRCLGPDVSCGMASGGESSEPKRVRVLSKLREQKAFMKKHLRVKPAATVRASLSLETSDLTTVLLDSEGSSDEEEEEIARVEPVKQARVLQRMKKYGGLLNGGCTGLTPLEVRSVSEKVWKEYEMKIEEMLGYFRRRGLTWATAEALDAGIV